MKGGRFISALMATLIVMLSVSDGQAQQKQDADGGKRVLAVLNGERVITEREVDDLIGPQLFSLQEKIYALRKEALEGLVNRAIIEEQARAKGETVEEFLSRLAPERVHIKQSQVEQVYAESAGRYAGLSEDEAKQRIRLDLETRERMAGYKSAIAELRKKARVELFHSAPSPPAINIAADGPARGPADAPVTIIEFSDFQCPYCKQASSTVEELIRAYGDSIRVVFKHLPLPIHPDAFKAAQAAACADEQGRFWEYHDRLFESADLTADSLRKYAGEIGLKASEFNSCLESESSRAVVVKNLQQARQAGIQGTPTFIINGVVLRGARGIDDFKRAIDEQLRASNATQPRQRGSGN